MAGRRLFAASAAGLLAAGAVSFLALWAFLPDPSALRHENPATTAFVRLRCSRDCPLEWTPLAGISPFLGEAVVVAEDQGFFRHGAVSWPTLRQAILKNLREGRIAWGGSTITMQLARNLYLSPDRTLRRKLLEIVLAFKIERALTKERILEIYLNVAEWAPDVFGAAAAARHYFDRSPAELGPLEASFLASILPSPGRAAEPAVRDTFRGKGALVFDRLMRSHLPVGDPDAAPGGTDGCAERLGEEEARAVDAALAVLFGTFGLQVASGDGALLSLEELLSPLTEEQRRLVHDLLADVGEGRPPIPCRVRGDGEEVDLVAWRQDEDPAAKRHWFPPAVLASVRSLVARAAADGIALRVRSAYRGDGYQAWLVIRELRLQGYCLDAVRKLIEAPGRSEHACLGGTAVDFAAPGTTADTFAQTPAYRWLAGNAADFGFRMSYPRGGRGAVGFEPWHWRFGAEGATEPRPAPR